MPLAKHLGEDGLLVAFEPQPEIYYTLCSNLRLNGLRNVELINAGVSRDATDMWIPEIDYDRDINSGGISFANPNVFAEQGGTRVRFRPLADLFTRRALHFMKIDAEGMEEDVLLGAKLLIEQHKPVIWVENDRPETSAAITRILIDMNYTLYWAITPLFNPNNHFAAHENVFGNAYTFNLACVPSERVSNFDVADLKNFDPAASHPLA